MEIRSTRSFDVVLVNMIRGTVNLYLSNLLCKLYCKYLIYFFSITVNF